MTDSRLLRYAIRAALALGALPLYAQAPEKAALGVVDFDIKGNLGEKDAGAIVAEMFIGRVDGKKYRLYERTQLNRLLRERNLQATDLVADPDKAVEFGKAARIRYLLVGTVSKLGDNIILGARTIDCESGEIGERATVNGSDMNQLPEMVDRCLLSMGLWSLKTASKGAPGYIGAKFTDITDAAAVFAGYKSAKEMCEKLGLGGKTDGVYIKEVPADGPAFKANMRAGDVVVEYNGKPVAGRIEFGDRVAATEPGTAVPVKVIRGGKPLILTVIILERPYDLQLDKMAQSLWKSGDMDGAIHTYRDLVRVKPGDPAAHYSLGTALCRKRDWEGAISSLREAIRLKPDYAEAHVELGWALENRGDLEGAMAEYKEARRIFPDYAAARVSVGNLLLRKGDVEGAGREFADLLRAAPENLSAHYGMGRVLAAKKDWDGAIASFRQAIRLKPEYTEAHFQLAFALATKGDVDAAMAEYKETLRLNPTHALAHNNVGAMLSNKGDADGAVREYNEAVRSNPQEPLPHWNLAGMYARRKDAARAVESLRKAIELDPKYKSLAAGDNRFAPIKDDQEFKRLIGQ